MYWDRAREMKLNWREEAQSVLYQIKSLFQRSTGA